MAEAPIKFCEYCSKYKLASSTLSAILKAMGKTEDGKRTRFVVESEINIWRRNNPQFRVADVYPKAA